MFFKIGPAPMVSRAVFVVLVYRQCAAYCWLGGRGLCSSGWFADCSRELLASSSVVVCVSKNGLDANSISSPCLETLQYLIFRCLVQPVFHWMLFLFIFKDQPLLPVWYRSVGLLRNQHRCYPASTLCWLLVNTELSLRIRLTGDCG